jgi:hypothetical protein
MRKWGSAVLAAAMLASTATFAGTDARDQGTLAPGGAAGVQKAEQWSANIWIPVIGAAAGIAVVAIILSNGSNNGAASTTTTGSP